jgi:hypothetical protein
MEMGDKIMRRSIAGNLKCAWAGSVAAALLLGVVAGCGSVPVTDNNGMVYHCVATDHPIPPPNTRAKDTPLERFEYGDYVDTNRPTISGSGYCNMLRVPQTAYLRYRVDDRVIEKHFDLSSLTARRVYNKTVEFYVDEDKVEVRLVTPVQGNWPIKEVIVRQ